MKKQFTEFQENVDAWVKQIKQEVSYMSDLEPQIVENTDNIQHNYELIHELRDEIEELKQEIQALKLIQIISLKSKRKEQDGPTPLPTQAKE